ncbi:hypothetical protein ElyMa_004264200 [Elysia marginata]|uniref:Uncharacterized protein n=1 Tax=Elysia marginata TaxID=1093978 RepID=A0AAV4GTK3_9GAST|nr:hypothetical protein ElyMa_004264200 [Elysia marginata]
METLLDHTTQTLLSNVANIAGNRTSVFQRAAIYTHQAIDWASNASGRANNATTNTTGSTGEPEPEISVHDIEYDMPLRKAILYLQIVIGILGAILLFIYMMHSRR